MSEFEALKGRRILITGHTGFKGSWLSLWLSEIGADLAGLALPPEGEDPLFDRLGLRSRMRHHEGDIRDLERVTEVFREERPEVVIHLAAQALVRRSFAEPKLTFDTNVGGSVNVLEAVRATPSVKACVYITSDKCYRNKEWVWGYRECDELGGRDPYSASKAAAEMVFSTWCDSYFDARPGFGIAAARAGNVIGGGDWAADRIVPDCIRALRAHRPVPVRNPGATRPWQHVLEPLSGYLTLAVRLLDRPKEFGGAWNFGPPLTSVRSVGALVEKAIATWGDGTMEVTAEVNAPHEARLLQLNTDHALVDLGWRPRWDADSAIENTVGWYREVIREGADARAVTLRQIRAYLQAGR